MPAASPERLHVYGEVAAPATVVFAVVGPVVAAKQIPLERIVVPLAFTIVPPEDAVVAAIDVTGLVVNVTKLEPVHAGRFEDEI